jgi:hypothetical protein
MAKSTKKAAKKPAKKVATKKEVVTVDHGSTLEEVVVGPKAKKAGGKKSKTSGSAFATFEKVKELVLAIDAEFVKFDNGTKAAGKRIRKNAMEIKRAMGALRNEVSAEVAAM